jgi:alpha-N-arabinofuranosidase
MRADLSQLLADMKLRFVRFPGGCLVYGDGLGYHQTTGPGYFEYFRFQDLSGSAKHLKMPFRLCR